MPAVDLMFHSDFEAVQNSKSIFGHNVLQSQVRLSVTVIGDQSRDRYFLNSGARSANFSAHRYVHHWQRKVLPLVGKHLRVQDICQQVQVSAVHE